MLTLDEMEELEKIVAPGPWHWDQHGKALIREKGVLICFSSSEDKIPCQDLEFITTAREWVPWAIARIRELEQQVRAMDVFMEEISGAD